MPLKNKILAGIGILAALVLLYALFDWAMSGIVHSRREVMVPDLKGKSLNDALAELSALNLGLRKEGEENDQSLPAGTILRQTPPAGMPVREGKIVKVTISQGGKLIYVPAVVGQPARAAEITVRSAGLAVGEVSSRYSLVGKKDAVIEQDPPAGSTAERDALVNLVVSAGAPPEGIRLMPDWNGKALDEAHAWAEKNGLVVQVTEENAPGIAPGTVLRQDPAPDRDLQGIGQVSFVVAGAAASGAAWEKVFYYEIPQGGDDRQVRLTLLDDNGEREIFRGVRAPGTKIAVPVNPAGRARVRVYINNILVEEREVE